MASVEIFQQFASHDWDSDAEFCETFQKVLQQRLEALRELDPTITSVPAHEQDTLAWQTKLYVFCSATGHILSLHEFLEWQEEKKEHSLNYNEIVDMIVQGKPVPGIKHIPDTVASDQALHLTATPRKKPWVSS